jgi:hypothetical protein
MPADMMPTEGAGGKSKDRTKMMFMGIAVLLAGLAIYVFIKMKKN